MAVKPIDLQVLFGKMAQVGKEQAHLKNMGAIHRFVDDNKLIEESHKKNQAVNKADETEQENKVKEDGENKGQQQQAAGQKKKKENHDENDDSYFHDPDLGQNIDLSG